MASTTTTSTKFVSEPKNIYPLSTENLLQLVDYSPNATAPDSLVSKVALPAGAFFCAITAATEVPDKRWSTVQIAASKHVELNSALVFMNHSCNPSLEIETAKMEVRVVQGRDLKKGDELSFFYPSTEWHMSQPFACLCGAGGECMGTVSGAESIDDKKLRKWFVNDHILKLKETQTTSASS